MACRGSHRWLYISQDGQCTGRDRAPESCNQCTSVIADRDHQIRSRGANAHSHGTQRPLTVSRSRSTAQPHFTLRHPHTVRPTPADPPSMALPAPPTSCQEGRLLVPRLNKTLPLEAPKAHRRPHFAFCLPCENTLSEQVLQSRNQCLTLSACSTAENTAPSDSPLRAPRGASARRQRYTERRRCYLPPSPVVSCTQHPKRISRLTATSTLSAT